MPVVRTSLPHAATPRTLWVRGTTIEPGMGKTLWGLIRG